MVPCEFEVHWRETWWGSLLLLWAATKHFVFNRQSQVGRNASWEKVKAQKYSEICKS